jgi:hypothetical protein
MRKLAIARGIVAQIFLHETEQATRGRMIGARGIDESGANHQPSRPPGAFFGAEGRNGTGGAPVVNGDVSDGPALAPPALPLDPLIPTAFESAFPLGRLPVQPDIPSPSGFWTRRPRYLISGWLGWPTVPTLLCKDLTNGESSSSGPIAGVMYLKVSATC